MANDVHGTGTNFLPIPTTPPKERMAYSRFPVAGSMARSSILPRFSPALLRTRALSSAVASHTFDLSMGHPFENGCNCPASNDLIEFAEKTTFGNVYVTGKISGSERRSCHARRIHRALV